jgi:hypothetical protein
VALATPDPVQLQPCLALASIDVPALPPREPFALPDGRRAVLLNRVIERDGVTSRLIVYLDHERAVCRSAVVYVADWIAAARAR